MSVCHCLACQKRIGGGFAVQARFAADAVIISGRSSGHARIGDEGGTARFHFRAVYDTMPGVVPSDSTTQGVLVKKRIGLLFLLAAASGPAAAMEIWSYAFVTRADEPISGHGSAIFEPSGESRVGPLRDADGGKYEIEFFAEGDRATGTLKAKKWGKNEIPLEGEAAMIRLGKGKGCLIQLQLSSGVHHVVLERVLDPC